MKNKNSFVEKIIIDVFGFSRGAAAARHFVSLLNAKTRPLKERLGTPQAEIIIKFVGLFDTVSSYGLRSSDNVKALGLALECVPKKVVHLTAGNEYRAHFSLTDITSSLGAGYELTLPGVHSNIGGSYAATEQEPRALHLDERAVLIAEGWYTEAEAPVQEADVYDPQTNAFLYTRRWAVGTREDVRADYQLIPLALMADHARKEAMRLEAFVDDFVKYALPADHHLAPVQAAIAQGVADHWDTGRYALTLADGTWQVPPGAAVTPLALTPAQVLVLRHGYLHRSASTGWQGTDDGRFGMGERRDDDHRPHRTIYPG